MTATIAPAALKAYFDNSSIALALADAGGDMPLVLVNRKFEDMTGYANEEIVGRNCRFLQGDADNPAAKERIRRFFASDEEQSVRTPILNFRKNGEPFVNLLFMSRLRSRDGAARYIFASQFDISRDRPQLLREYDSQLGDTLTALSDSGFILGSTLDSLANTAKLIAEAKLMLAELAESERE